jgi:hypothetical protein
MVTVAVTETKDVGIGAVVVRGMPMQAHAEP